MPQTVYRTCTLCEATCGLKFDVEDNRIVSVRPDDDDVFSQGYACPKGIAIGEIHHDPDRLRSPMRRNAAGEFEPISWQEAFELVGSRLGKIREQHGNDAIGFYWGNPLGNNHGAILMLDALSSAIGTRNRFSAGSQDANPRLVTSMWMYGSSVSSPIPDIDRTDYFLCLGANPLISNGSVMTAPDMKGRLRAVRERGGKVVVVDPRRTETARVADEFVAIRPGTDAALLLAMAQVLVENGRVDSDVIAQHTQGWDEVESLLEQFTPERVAAYSGVDADTIRRLALEFVDAPSSVAYSRMGVCVAKHATLATYATDLLNVLAGRLGRTGGAMFPVAAFDLSDLARKTDLDGHGRWHSRVSGLPESFGDLPSTVLAEEIETPGDGQIRAMVTFAGNPVLSAPNGNRIGAALEKLDFMVSIDIYLNETTRHADLVLPPCWSLAEDHVDLLFSQVMVRTIARWSPAVVEREDGELADWEIMLAIAEQLGGGPTGNATLDRVLAWLRPLGLGWEPDRVANLVLRIGPYGDRFMPWSKGLNLAKLKKHPHGIDLGPMKEGIEHRMYHQDRRIAFAPPQVVEGLKTLGAELDEARADDELLLIGRRELRTNNSWMHNAPSLVSGKDRCVLYLHPTDADRHGIGDGDHAVLGSRVHKGLVQVHVTDEMRPGVVSLPHGWGHEASAPWQQVAGAHAGVSANDWIDDGVVESIIGQSILNGVPVTIERVAGL